MTVERKVHIHDRDFYLGVELKYGKNKFLYKTNSTGFDMGDLGVMIDYVENTYEKESKEMIYDSDVSYMNDIIYLYERFPFISYIKDITYNNEGHIALVGCISKEEIDDYIKTNNIVMNKWDKKNSPCPLLYL